jgi:hypothetical protein
MVANNRFNLTKPLSRLMPFAAAHLRTIRAKPFGHGFPG